MKSMGWIRCALVIATWGATACSQTENCVVTCAQDTDCPGGQSCTLAGRCSSEDTCPCEPGAFLGCVEPGAAAFCADTGDTTRTETCGAPGCNAEAGRCNECVPGESTCDAETTISSCGADGLPASMETCALPCVDDPAGARCGHIVPVWLPDVCDAGGTMESVSFPAGVTVDTTLDVNCPEIVPQADGPELCVFHADEITLDKNVTFVGSRPIVFVADRDLKISASLIASADAAKSGPGGGFEVSGDGPMLAAAGGGAGFKAAGAAGGAPAGNGQGGAGGTASDPTTRAFFAGGPRADSGGSTSSVKGGGGGGGVLLVSCRGKVELTALGAVMVNGGGGPGGRDTLVATAGEILVGGGGGGAGGYAVFEGADVAIAGRVYANGGGGGAGCSGDNCVGAPGTNGKASADAAPGGISTNGGGNGGAGAAGTAATVGLAGTSAGGGGGGTGRFQVYTPAGRTPTITPSTASPAFEAPRTVETR